MACSKVKAVDVNFIQHGQLQNVNAYFCYPIYLPCPAYPVCPNKFLNRSTNLLASQRYKQCDLTDDIGPHHFEVLVAFLSLPCRELLLILEFFIGVMLL